MLRAKGGGGGVDGVDYRVISQPGNEVLHQMVAAVSLSGSLAGTGLYKVVIAVPLHPPTVESPVTPSCIGVGLGDTSEALPCHSHLPVCL